MNLTFDPAGNHVAPERVRRLAAGAELPSEPDRRHLAGCSGCAEALAADRALTIAARSVDAHQREPLVVPPFAALLADPRLRAAMPRREQPVTAVSAARGTTWRLSAEILLAQLRFFSPWVGAVAAAWTVVATVLCFAVQDLPSAARLSGAVVSLLLMSSGVFATGTRSDARMELLQSLPTSPRLVYLFRLVGAMAVSLALGLLVSLVGGARTGQFGGLISLWLGPGLLAASVAALVAVRWNVAAGQSAGLLVWALCSASRIPTRAADVGLAGVLHAHWASSPLAVLVAVLVFTLAVRAVPGQDQFSVRT